MPRLLKSNRRTGAGLASIREVCLVETRADRSAALAAGDRLRRGGREYRVASVHPSGGGRGYVHLTALPLGS